METRFTKGEWSACCLDAKPHFVFAGEKTVCTMLCNDKTMPAYEPMEAEVTIDECVANAKLIAAAPDLLAACDEMVKYFDVENLSQCDAYYKLKDAIKKATE